MGKTVLILLNLCLLFSCGLSQNENEEHVYVINVDEAEKKGFSSMFDSVAYIPLETTDECEIGRISRVLYHNGKYIVVDELTNTVFIFTEDGRYYSKIQAAGNGPGEYAQMADIAIDKFEEKIKILDAMQVKVVSFDLDGHFTGETKLPVSPSPIRF